MKTVWTNGCFDILHRGHIEMFKFAKSLGDRLIVGLDTDEKVKEAKGNDRPFNTLEDRSFVVSSIGYVDKTMSFNSQYQLEDLIKQIKPDILIWEKEITLMQYQLKKTSKKLMIFMTRGTQLYTGPLVVEPQE